MICWFCRKQNVLLFFCFSLIVVVISISSICDISSFALPVIHLCCWHCRNRRHNPTILRFATTVHYCCCRRHHHYLHLILAQSFVATAAATATNNEIAQRAQCHRACSNCSCICISTRLIQYLIKISGWPIWVSFFLLVRFSVSAVCVHVSAHFSREVGCERELNDL